MAPGSELDRSEKGGPEGFPGNFEGLGAWEPFGQRPGLCLGEESEGVACVCALWTYLGPLCAQQSGWCLHINPGLFPGYPGCFVSGLYLEGADWDVERGCLIKSKPKVLVVDLPILKIIPIEAHRLKLQVEG